MNQLASSSPLRTGWFLPMSASEHLTGSEAVLAASSREEPSAP